MIRTDDKIAEMKRQENLEKLSAEVEILKRIVALKEISGLTDENAMKIISLAQQQQMNDILIHIGNHLKEIREGMDRGEFRSI